MIAVLLASLLTAAELGPAATTTPVTLTLADAAALARAHGPAAQRAAVVRQGALESLEAQRAGMRPDLDFQARTDAGTPTLRDPALPHALVQPAFQAIASLSAEQILLAAGGDALHRRLAAGRAAAQADYEAALAKAACEARLAWLDLVAAKAGFAVADEAVRAAEAQSQRVADLLAVQRVADVDRLQAEAGVLEARSARVEAAGGVALAAAALNRLLGSPVLDRPLAADLPDDLPPALGDLAAAIKEAQAHRPEVIALRARAAEAAAGVELARAGDYPTVSATAGLAARTRDAFDPAFDARLGLVVRWPLSRTDGEARRHAAEADDGARQARQALTELLGGIELEVRRAWTDDQTARQKVDLAAARADAATEALRIKVLQYDRARATLLDVTQARLEMSRAALDKITARLAVHRAAVAAALATGRS